MIGIANGNDDRRDGAREVGAEAAIGGGGGGGVDAAVASEETKPSS